MKIPLVDLKAQYTTIKPEIDFAIQTILDNTSFIMGDPLKKFEENLAKFCDCKYAIGVANGTAALFLALKAYGIDEVITVPNSFIATAEVIVHCGAKPVFVDVDEKTMLMDANLIEKAITNKTKAIIPVHLYGQICDMDRIIEIAKKHSLAVIEDAAQAIDAEYKGRKLPVSDTATFSFFPAKNLGCYGDGGAVITKDENVALMVRKLRDHGRIGKYESDIIGYAERLDTLQAAILDVKLNHLKEWSRKRKENASKYNRILEKVKGIKIPFEEEYSKHVYYMYIIKVKNREKIIKSLKDNGISTGIHYPMPLHLQPALRYLGYKKGDFAVTERTSEEILSIPMYPEIKDEEIVYVCEEIKRFI
jgi:dTDP-4-amino-4,6-dideoxygalactose transaminase